MSAVNSGITPILGTMTFGSEAQIDPDTAGTLLRSFVGSGCTKTSKGALVDPAGFYSSDADSTLGQIFDMFPSLQRMMSISSHASREVKPHYSLSKQSVVDQCDASLESLGIDCFDVFYLHAPDIDTDIEDTLSGIADLHQTGKIAEFGLCNYPAWAVVDIWHRCKRLGILVPTVYQGRYNVLSRDIEQEIVPVAREFGLRIYVYNPLAGGLLSGRYKDLEDVTSATKGRFSEEFDKSYGGASNAGTVTYRNRYAKPLVFKGLGVIRKACAPVDTGERCEQPKVVQDETSVVDGRRVRLVVTETAAAAVPQGLDVADVALRWLIHHSRLTQGDGIIVGVSQSKHLVANLAAWRAGPLDEALLEACDMAWETARPACDPYFDVQSFLKRKRSKDAACGNSNAEEQNAVSES